MNTRARSVAVSTVGYMCLAIAFWMASMTNAGWYSNQYSVAILAPLAILVGVMGILAFVAHRGLDAVVFFGGAALLVSAAAYVGVSNSVRLTYTYSYLGWFACMWGIYFLCTWVGSLKAGMMRSSFLLALWLALGCLAVGSWSGVMGWTMAGGYLGLISGVLAFVTAGSEIIRFGRISNPNAEVAPVVRPMAAD